MVVVVVAGAAALVLPLGHVGAAVPAGVVLIAVAGVSAVVAAGAVIVARACIPAGHTVRLGRVAGGLLARRRAAGAVLAGWPGRPGQ